jgi:MHS family proline/betaine transporter-like MFS transporter
MCKDNNKNDNSNKKFPLKPLIFGSLAAAFEWYDYALFGYFAAIIGSQFFPSKDPSLSLLSSFAVFATGFAMRPLGAVLFGHIGDRVGRKYALAASLIMMALPTTLLSFLPTYDMIGIWAPILLVFLRLLQGMAVGGNYGGSFIFTIENAPPHQKGFAGSLASFGTLAGLLLGSGAATHLSSLLNADQMALYGWRIPFFLGSLSGLIGLLIRRLASHDHLSSNKTTLATQTPLQEIVPHHLGSILQAMVIIMLDGVGVYVAFVFMTTYATSFLKMPMESVLMINTVTMGILVAAIPFFGWLGDRLRGLTGKNTGNPVLVGACLVYLFLSIPLFWYLIETRTLSALWALQIVFAIAMGAVYGVIPVTVAGSFPKAIRYTASGLSFNISVALFGGTAPLLVTSLINKTGVLMVPAFMLSLVGLLSLIAVKTTKEASV